MKVMAYTHMSAHTYTTHTHIHTDSMDKSNFKKTGQDASHLETKNKAGYNAVT